MAKKSAEKQVQRNSVHCVMDHMAQARKMDEHERYAKALATIGQETYVANVTGPNVPEGTTATIIVDWRTSSISEVVLSMPDSKKPKGNGKGKQADEKSVAPESPEKSEELKNAVGEKAGDGGQSQGGESGDQASGIGQTDPGNPEQANGDADGEVRQDHSAEVTGAPATPADKPNPFAA